MLRHLETLSWLLYHLDSGDLSLAVKLFNFVGDLDSIFQKIILEKNRVWI